jgi:hypothetical protein
MKIFNTKKSKRIITILIILITLLEMYFAYWVLYHYRGIYQVSIFIPFLLQLIWYRSLSKPENGHRKFKKNSAIVISISLPWLIYFTLPNYTYDEGKRIIINHLEENENLMFSQYPFGQDTIPVINNPKGIFMLNRAYYYKITLPEGDKYFMVCPITGELRQLSDKYW